MTTKHTPAPWHYQPGRDSRPPYVIRGSEGGFVVIGMTADRQEADAALIASAPELLAMVELMLPWLEADERAWKELSEAQAVITKAKGEQQ